MELPRRTFFKDERFEYDEDGVRVGSAPSFHEADYDYDDVDVPSAPRCAEAHAIIETAATLGAMREPLRAHDAECLFCSQGQELRRKEIRSEKTRRYNEHQRRIA